MRKNSPLMGRAIASHVRLTPTVLGLLLLAGLSTLAAAQMAGGASNPEVQQKIAALKQSAAEHKQQKVFQCSYGPNGQVMKVPMGEQQQAPQQRGRLRERVVEKKTDEMKENMQQVQSLL